MAPIKKGKLWIRGMNVMQWHCHIDAKEELISFSANLYFPWTLEFLKELASEILR